MEFDVLSFVMGQQAGKKNGGAELLENVPIVVDFSNGNQTFEAAEGQAVKSAVIQKPENLAAENIAEGVNIAGVTGTLAGGGSSLPSGVYLSVPSYPRPTTNIYNVFKYKGEIYATYGSDNNLYGPQNITKYLCKLNPLTNEWVTVLSNTGTHGIGGDYNFYGLSMKYAECNGLLHCMESSRHYTFDGENLAYLGETGCSGTARYLTEYQGKLYVQDYTDGTAHVWENNVWTKMDETEFPAYSYPCFFKYREKLYYAGMNDPIKQKLFEYVDGSWQQIGTLTKRFDEIFATDKGVYYTAQASNRMHEVYKIDLETGTDVFVGKIPQFYVRHTAQNWGSISFIGSTYSNASGYTLPFEVTIVE